MNASPVSKTINKVKYVPGSKIFSFFLQLKRSQNVDRLQLMQKLLLQEEMAGLPVHSKQVSYIIIISIKALI